MKERRDEAAPAPASAEEADWIERARGGDQAAYGRLVERYQKRVYSVAYGIVRDRDEAWDLAQDAFVKAYKNLHRFDGKSAFYTWMYRVTYNLALDHVRSYRKRMGVRFSQPSQVDQALQDEGRPTHFTDPADLSDRRELTRILHDAMNQLGDRHRAIIVLREVEELSYEEIAQVLGIPKGTVMSRLHHARKQLQGILEPYVQRGEAVLDEAEWATDGGSP